MEIENFRKLEAGRMYEITGVAANHAWASSRSDSCPLLRAIVSSTSPERRYQPLTIHKQGPRRIYNLHPYVDLVGLTFRPLNKKDQAKIEENAHGS